MERNSADYCIGRKQIYYVCLFDNQRQDNPWCSEYSVFCGIVFAACDSIEDTHVCSFGETWSFDGTNHYHACKSCNAQSDVAKHADANNDGACDECAFILSSDHTFASEWTTDALNHWHASLCGHDVVDAKAAHTANALGVCSVCGVKVSSITVETLEDALELALAQDYAAKSGTVFYSHQQYDYEWEEWITVDTMSYFEKSEGYLHAIEYGEYLETWYYAVGEGVWSVINVNGECGGYNLQWAFSSGVCVANAIIAERKGGARA